MSFGLAAALVLIALLVGSYFVVRTRIIAARAERMVPPAGKFMTIDGCRIHYVEAGEGRPIVCIHGLGAQLHQFRSTLLPELSRDFRVIALDRPGSGYSTRPFAASGRVMEQARIIARFIDELKLERPLVVGHSLGGAVALALALGHPDRISGLALLAPLTRHRETIPPQLAPLYVKPLAKRWLLAQTVAVPLAQKYAAVALAYVFGPQKPAVDYMTAGGGWLGLRPAAVFANCTDVVALEEDMPDLEKRVGEITMPVGVLFGSADQMLDFKLDGLSLRDRLPSVTFEQAEGIGHMLQFAATAQTLAFVRRMAAKSFEVKAEGSGVRGG
jgi:pimeloyl-ACP methyl ester carboxylesterase